MTIEAQITAVQAAHNANRNWIATDAEAAIMNQIAGQTVGGLLEVLAKDELDFISSRLLFIEHGIRDFFDSFWGTDSRIIETTPIMGVEDYFCKLGKAVGVSESMVEAIWKDNLKRAEKRVYG